MINRLSLFTTMLVLWSLPSAATPPIVVEDYEKSTGSLPTWVVNIPETNASAKVSSLHPHDGKQCLDVHYKFTEGTNYQYIGVANKVKIQSAVHRLHFYLYGNSSRCTFGVQLQDAFGETHQYARGLLPHGGIVDFTGWQEVSVDLDAGHETWGGDKNGKIDYPITAITFTVGQPGQNSKNEASEGDIYYDGVSVESEKSAAETLGSQVSVISPPYCSEVRGDTKIVIDALGFATVTAKCWKQGGKFGSDSTVATVNTDPFGKCSFVLHADQYPHGPITVRISGVNGSTKDNCYLQLYNRGGIAWNSGLPKEAPPAATGMTLLYADDFSGPMSISATDPAAKYYDHKPPNGVQDFSVHGFSDPGTDRNPFSQTDSYLRIRANDATHSSGLICSIKNDGTGIKAAAPCYFECRFIGPNAIGSWPAFWLMTDYMTDYKLKGDKTPVDELDIIEAYGGEGPHEPNAYDTFMITPHCWNQSDELKALGDKAFATLKNPCHMKSFGIPSTWYESFHTYGCKVTETETIYYVDDIEVGRHATLPICKDHPLFFMINLATGGGWPVDLSRYGKIDMYVDWVRVYKK